VEYIPIQVEKKKKKKKTIMVTGACVFSTKQTKRAGVKPRLSHNVVI
jgi:hypothetical protein